VIDPLVHPIVRFGVGSEPATLSRAIDCDNLVWDDYFSNVTAVHFTTLRGRELLCPALSLSSARR
jgi:hypothetical protein